MTSLQTSFSEVGRLVTVAVKHARDAFIDEATIGAQWQALNFLSPPDLGAAVDEFDRFVDILRSSGADVQFLPRDPETTLDSIYARDASIVSPQGLIFARMGKPARHGEPGAQERAFRALGRTPIAGRITAHGLLEGGDVIWLDQRTIVMRSAARVSAV